MGLCSWYDVICGVVSASKWAVHHPWQAVGLVAGVAAAATGVGAVVEVAAEATAVGIGFGVTATITGIAATSIDGSYCASGDRVSCVGLALGVTGTLTGGFAAAGSLLAVPGSLADSVFQGLGAFSSNIGIAGSIADTTFTIAVAKKTKPTRTRKRSRGR